MKKSWIGVVAALIVILVVVLLYQHVTKVSGEIRIGAILPLTGDAAQWGVQPGHGITLGAEQINGDGGIDGKKIHVFFQDDQGDPQKAVSAFLNLRTTYPDIRLMIGAVTSSATLAIAPIAEKDKILLISPASTNPKITDAGDFIFRDIPTDALRGKVFAEYIYQKEGIRKIALLYINNDAGVGNKDAFAKRFKELGGEILGEESYEEKATDVRGQLTKLNSLQPQAIMVVSYPADTIIVVRQARELIPQIPLFFQAEAVEDPSVINALGKDLDGVKYILPDKPQGPVVEKFVSDYQKRFGSPPGLFAAEGYDCIMLLAQGIKNCKGVTDSNCVKELLYSVNNYQGASGTISFDKNGDVIKPMAVREIQNYKPITIYTSK